jgi:DNA polymerase delta subunit 2
MLTCVHFSGTLVAVYGKELEEDPGKFQVEDFCFPPLPPQSDPVALEEDKYVVFASGLDIGSETADLLSLQMMADLFTGQLGDPGQQQKFASISRFILAGNSLSEHTQDKESISKVSILPGLFI